MNFKQALATVAAVFMPLAAAKACQTCGTTNPVVVSGPTASASANATVTTGAVTNNNTLTGGSSSATTGPVTVNGGGTNIKYDEARNPVHSSLAFTPAYGECVDKSNSWSANLFFVSAGSNSFTTREACTTLNDAAKVSAQFNNTTGQLFAIQNSSLIYNAVAAQAQYEVMARDDAEFAGLTPAEKLIRAVSHGQVKVTNTTNEYKTKSNFSFGN